MIKGMKERARRIKMAIQPTALKNFKNLPIFIVAKV
jgi:hypothetical protein